MSPAARSPEAAIVAGFTGPGPALPPPGDADVPTRGDLAAQAADHGDPHAVKFTEAALREHARRPDDAYLLAARQVLAALPRWSPRSARGGTPCSDPR